MIYSGYQSFLDKVFSGLRDMGIDVSDMEIDHIAYQTASSLEYDELKPELLKDTTLIREVIVNGRRVGVFKFNTAITYNSQKVEAIELIEPSSKEEAFNLLLYSRANTTYTTLELQS
ncbi:MAG: VOC family protein [Candidatus Dojkabacteria bacterium]|nr:MAG: VOC family protein [Candidatus Dojkabacteria bacterium]